MKSIKLNAFAKLNLSLNVLSKKIGAKFHKVKFLNCEIASADKIKIKKIEQKTKRKFHISCGRQKCEKIDEGILINLHTKTSCDVGVKCKWQENDCYDSSCPENCLAYQAAKLLQKKFPKKIEGVEITIDKKIPTKAGLGSGSADAAAVLRGMNKLYNLELSQKELIKIAVRIGMDVCYSVVGGLCKVEGIGEKITPLNPKISSSVLSDRTKQVNLRKLYLVIVVPKIKKPSTAWCYQNLDKRKIGKNLDKFEKIVNLLSRQKKISSVIINLYPLNTIRYLHNDFEPLIFSRFPEVRKIKEKLLVLGAENAILAGSGLSVVGFYIEKNIAQKAINIMTKKYQTFLAKIL
ncbi:MAG: hypothetical protein AB1465_05260 [Patescibacteria group bacterium]